MLKMSVLQKPPPLQKIHFSKRLIENGNFIFDLICDSDNGGTFH